MVPMSTPARCLSLAVRTGSDRPQHLMPRRALRNWSQSRDDASFQFKCTQCGKCCTGKGGRVRVNEREIEEIADALHIASTKEVKATYLRRAADPLDTGKNDGSQQQQQQWWFLKQTPDDAQCIFLDGAKCSIYKARPTQCRTFPWWPQNLISDYDWQLTARDCEGISLPSSAPESSQPVSVAIPATQVPTYTFDDILPEVILHDIHRSGENFTYNELQEMITDLQEVDADFESEYKSELFANYSRKVVFRDARVTVLDTFLRDVAPTRCFFFNDRIHLVQSEVTLKPEKDAIAIDRSTLVLDVHRAMCMALAIQQNAVSQHDVIGDKKTLSVTVIGSGAASLPLFLLDHVPEIARLDAVEPNTAVNRVAREFFGLGEAEKNDQRVTVRELMGEAFVAEQLSNGMRYDLIMLDVESGEDDAESLGIKAPPKLMLTSEFLGSLKELLVPSEGVLVVNVIAEAPAALMRAEEAFMSVFTSGGLVVELPKNAVFYLFADQGRDHVPATKSSYGSQGDERDELMQLLERDAFQCECVQAPELLLKSTRAPDDRVGANQAHNRRWEVKGDRSIQSFTANLPGRTFVTYASDSPRNLDAEVMVSGSSEDFVKAVDVSALFRTMRVELVTPTTALLVGQYMLVEVRVRDKDVIFGLESEGNGDVVVLEDVLASIQATSAPLLLARRLQGIEDNVQLVLAEAKTPSFLSTTTSSVATGLNVTEDTFTTTSSASIKDVTPLRSWMLGGGSGLDKGGNVNLELSVPGAAVISELMYLEREYPYAGRVMIFGDDAIALDQIEVVASGGKLQVRSKSSVGGTNFTTLVGFSEKYQVTLAKTSSSKADVQVRTDTINSTMYWEKSALMVSTNDAGNIFVSAPKSIMCMPRITIETYGDGSVQMDVGKAWAAKQATFRSGSKGTPSLNWFGDILHSAVVAYPSSMCKFCISTKYPAHSVAVTSRNKDRVAYTGQTGSAKVECHLTVASAAPSPNTNSTQNKPVNPATGSGGALAPGAALYMVCVSFLAIVAIVF